MVKHNVQNKSVLVVDSGVGGMTVVKAIRDLAPALTITYISDNACFPYGGMGADALITRIHFLVSHAIKAAPVDAVVIACNTASTVVLDQLRTSFSVPIVGVVPPIKTAGEISRSRVIGLLATEGTVRRQYVDSLIERFAHDCTVLRVQCPDLAPLAERKFRGRRIDRQRLRDCINPLMAPELAAMDVVVLGCTHYPLLLDELRQEFPPSVQWLDPALPVARRLIDVLGAENPNARPALARPHDDVVYFTNDVPPFQSMNPRLTEIGFSRTAHWPNDAEISVTA